MNDSVKWKNRKTGVVYDYIGELMLNKATTTALKDGSLLVILRTKSGRVIARPKDEFKDGRFIRLKPMTARRE